MPRFLVVKTDSILPRRVFEQACPPQATARIIVPADLEWDLGEVTQVQLFSGFHKTKRTGEPSNSSGTGCDFMWLQYIGYKGSFSLFQTADLRLPFGTSAKGSQ